MDASKLEIDYGNLIGIAIYIVLKSGMASLLIDCLFIESFVSNAILATNRAYHMTVIETALEFIEEKLPNFYKDETLKSPLADRRTP